MGFKMFWFFMCDICHGFLEGWVNTLLSKYLDIRVFYVSGPLLYHENMFSVIQMKQTWDLYRCNKNTLVLSQKQREVIYLITKEYKRIILLSLPYCLRYLQSLNQLPSAYIWSWCKCWSFFVNKMLPESPVDHLQMYTTEVKSASASENHSESVFMEEYTCSATGSVLCAKNYFTSPVIFSVSSNFFSKYSSRYGILPIKPFTFWLLSILKTCSVSLLYVSSWDQLRHLKWQPLYLV